MSSIKGKARRSQYLDTTRTSESSTGSAIASGTTTAAATENDDSRRGGVEPFEWDVYAELIFYKILIGIRPVGLNKHISMMIIYDKFVKELNRDPNTVHVDHLWKKLRTMYDLDKLEQIPECRNPWERTIATEDKEFALPKDYSKLLHDKQRQSSPSPPPTFSVKLTTPSTVASSTTSTKSSKKT